VQIIQHIFKLSGDSAIAADLSYYVDKVYRGKMNALKGRAAFITGGSRGIGAAIAERLAQEGADVAITYVSGRELAEKVVERVKAMGRDAMALQADSADVSALKQAIGSAAARFGRLDILVNNAGIVLRGSPDTATIEDIDRIFAVNVRSAFVAVQNVLPHMGAGGRIIMMGSCNAERMPAPNGALYAMTKSALIGLTKGLARDLGPRGITVNNVQPGPTDTDMNPADGPAADYMHKMMAIPQHGTAADIAAMVAYLAGPEAGFVTGASLTIDGGFTA